MLVFEGNAAMQIEAQQVHRVDGGKCGKQMERMISSDAGYCFNFFPDSSISDKFLPTTETHIKNSYKFVITTAKKT